VFTLRSRDAGQGNQFGPHRIISADALTGATIAKLMARLGHSAPAAAMRYQHAAAGRNEAIAAALSKIALGS
jgi:hypothetical protein